MASLLAVAPATHIGDYEILSTLGSGGMGVVYKARDLRLQRTVALKFLSPSSRNGNDRVLREARAASVLDHPNIVSIHAVEQANDGAWFLVMAYYEGETLEERIARDAIPLADALRIVAQIARGLAHAHDHGILHRDIKPSNVVLTRDGIAKIVDFGLAHHLDLAASTQSAAFSGTLAYMSPEQLQAAPLDARSDIWSLGVLLYYLLARELPFTGRSAADHITTILHAPMPPIPGLCASVESILRRMLAKQPAARYARCSDLLADLEAAQFGQSPTPVAPRPVPLFGRMHGVRAGILRLDRRLVAGALGIILLGATALALRPLPPPPVGALAAGAADASRQFAVALFHLALLLDSRGAPAASLYRNAIALDPRNASAHNALAHFYYRHGESERAIAEWRLGVGLAPANARAQTNLGVVLVTLHQTDEAEVHLRKAVELAPDDANLSNLGYLFYEQKRWAESADKFKEALQHNPADYNVWANLGLAYEWMNQREAAAEAYRQEMRLLEPAAAAAPSNASLQVELALLYAKQRRREAALAAVRRALALAPHDPRVLSNAGETYETLDDRPQALDLIRRAVERGKTLDQLDHNPGLRRLLADSRFRSDLAQLTRNLAAPRGH